MQSLERLRDRNERLVRVLPALVRVVYQAELPVLLLDQRGRGALRRDQARQRVIKTSEIALVLGVLSTYTYCSSPVVVR